MTLHALACFHLRPQLHEIFIASLSKWADSATLVFDNDELGTQHMTAVQSLCEKYNLDANCIQRANNPVSDKHNHALFEALKTKDNWDAVVIMGTDDLMSVEGAGLIADALTKHKYVGFNTVNFFNSLTFEWLQMKYDTKRLVGCGRAIRKDVFDQLTNLYTVTFRKDHTFAGKDFFKGVPYDVTKEVAEYLESIEFVKIVSKQGHGKGLWESGLNRSLDHSSEMHLITLGIAPYTIKTDKVHLIDIKTEQNVTFWGRLKGEMNPSDPMWFVDEDIKAMISRLKFVV